MYKQNNLRSILIKTVTRSWAWTFDHIFAFHFGVDHGYRFFFLSVLYGRESQNCTLSRTIFFFFPFWHGRLLGKSSIIVIPPHQRGFGAVWPLINLRSCPPCVPSRKPVGQVIGSGVILCFVTTFALPPAPPARSLERRKEKKSCVFF